GHRQSQFAAIRAGGAPGTDHPLGPAFIVAVEFPQIERQRSGVLDGKSEEVLNEGVSPVLFEEGKQVGGLRLALPPPGELSNGGEKALLRERLFDGTGQAASQCSLRQS